MASGEGLTKAQIRATLYQAGREGFLQLGLDPDEHHAVIDEHADRWAEDLAGCDEEQLATAIGRAAPAPDDELTKSYLWGVDADGLPEGMLHGAVRAPGNPPWLTFCGRKFDLDGGRGYHAARATGEPALAPEIPWCGKCFPRRHQLAGRLRKGFVWFGEQLRRSLELIACRRGDAYQHLPAPVLLTKLQVSATATAEAFAAHGPGDQVRRAAAETAAVAMMIAHVASGRQLLWWHAPSLDANRPWTVRIINPTVRQDLTLQVTEQRLRRLLDSADAGGFTTWNLPGEARP